MIVFVVLKVVDFVDGLCDGAAVVLVESVLEGILEVGAVVVRVVVVVEEVGVVEEEEVDGGSCVVGLVRVEVLWVVLVD